MYLLGGLMENHWKRREKKRFNKRKHKTTGRSVFDILKIWERNWKGIGKALERHWKDIKENGKNWKGRKGIK